MSMSKIKTVLQLKQLTTVTMPNVKYTLFLIISTATFSDKLAAAALSERRAATWNLQGSSASTEDKWARNVRHLVTGDQRVDVLALQEAGTPPASARTQAPLRNRLIDPQDLHQEVHEYKWNIGTPSRPDNRWIYYTQNDQGDNRVNLALVTNEKPDHVIILKPPGDHRSVGPILGVRFNKDNYFTVHASGSRGGNAADIINVIANYFGSRQKRDHQFVIMGDFSTNPDDLRSSLNREHPNILEHMEIYHTDTSTQNGGGVVDYAVIGQYNYDLPNHLTVHATKSTFRGQLESDHKPVLFDIDEHSSSQSNYNDNY